MSIATEKMSGLPIALITGTAPLVEKDALDSMQAAIELKKEFPGKKVYRVIDFSHGIDFSGMMICMAAEAGKEGGANDPEVETYFVGSSELVELGVKALQEQEQYGTAPNVHLFLSLDEAVNLAVKNAGGK
jgi:hypothetical protein